MKDNKTIKKREPLHALSTTLPWTTTPSFNPSNEFHSHRIKLLLLNAFCFLFFQSVHTRKLWNFQGASFDFSSNRKPTSGFAFLHGFLNVVFVYGRIPCCFLFHRLPTFLRKFVLDLVGKEASFSYASDIINLIPCIVQGVRCWYLTA